MGLLYRQKLKKRAKKVQSTKLLEKFDPTSIILMPYKSQKAWPVGERIEKIKVKVPVIDEKTGEKKRDEKWRVITKEEEREIVKYTFVVAKNANKNDIKKAISLLYWIDESDILKVNTMRVPPKYRLMRGLVRGSFKKAIVTLKPGKRISIVKTEK